MKSPGKKLDEFNYQPTLSALFVPDQQVKAFKAVNAE